MLPQIYKIKQDFKKRPLRTLFKAVLLIAVVKIIWTFAWLNLNPLDPNNPFFNPEYFRFSNYDSDPLYREEVARAVFPKGMPEEDVDDILITDIFVGKVYDGPTNAPIKGHVYYVYSPAPWRMLQHVDSVIYDDSHRLIDVFPSNGRGIHSGKQLKEIRAEGRMSE